MVSDDLNLSDDSNRGPRENTVIYGSGLSGMIAAYINARALEDDAAHNANWHPQQAFRPMGQSWVTKWRDWRRRGSTAIESCDPDSNGKS